MVRARACLLLAAAVLAAAGPAGPSRKQRIAELSEEDRRWLTEYVAPIILPDEEKLFLELTEEYQREAFRREFWERRERPGLRPPFGPGYRQRYENLREVAASDYDGLESDAGRLVVRYGEPDRIQVYEECSGVFRDVEVWSYRSGLESRSERLYLFYRFGIGTPRKLWIPAMGDAELLQPATCLSTISQGCLVQSGGALPQGTSNDPACKFAAPKTCSGACQISRAVDDIRARSGAGNDLSLLMAAPPVSLEGLESFRNRFAGLSAPDAKKLDVVGPGSQVPASAAPPPAPVRKLSKKELLAALPDEERQWLTEYVAPIILAEEEKLFLELAGYELEAFKKDFWKRRERDGLPPPFGPGFERRYEELRPRLDSVYDGWRNDAGRMVLNLGEPAEIHHVEGCDKVFRDLEMWTYRNPSEVARQPVHHLLYRPAPVVPRKLWRADNTSTGGSSLQNREIFSPESCRQSLGGLLKDCKPAPGDKCLGPVCFEGCDVYRVYLEVLARQGSALGGLIESGRLLVLPAISTEGLEQLRNSFATTADPNAKKIAVESPSSKPVARPVPAPEPRHWLSADEMRERILHLEPKYKKWLELAGPLLTLNDLSLFLQMSSSEKDRFMRAFWKRPF